MGIFQGKKAERVEVDWRGLPLQDTSAQDALDILLEETYPDLSDEELHDWALAQFEDESSIRRYHIICTKGDRYEEDYRAQH